MGYAKQVQVLTGIYWPLQRESAKWVRNEISADVGLLEGVNSRAYLV